MLRELRLLNRSARRVEITPGVGGPDWWRIEGLSSRVGRNSGRLSLSPELRDDQNCFGGPCSFLYMALPVEPRSSPSPSLAGCDQASYRIKEKPRSYPAAGEVEQTVQRSRFLVGGTVANPSQAPVILDEAKDRGLVGDLMVHVVLPRKRGDHEQRESRTVTATPLGGRRGVSAAETGTGQKVIADLRLIDDRIHYVVVPAVRIIVSDNDGGVSPERAGLNLVDGINQEFL